MKYSDVYKVGILCALVQDGKVIGYASREHMPLRKTIPPWYRISSSGFCAQNFGDITYMECLVRSLHTVSA